MLQGPEGCPGALSLKIFEAERSKGVRREVRQAGPELRGPAPRPFCTPSEAGEGRGERARPPWLAFARSLTPGVLTADEIGTAVIWEGPLHPAPCTPRPVALTAARLQRTRRPRARGGPWAPGPSSPSHREAPGTPAQLRRAPSERLPEQPSRGRPACPAPARRRSPDRPSRVRPSLARTRPRSPAPALGAEQHGETLLVRSRVTSHAPLR